MKSPFRTILKINLALLAVSTPLFFGIQPAQASSTCKDVFLVVHNQTGQTVRIIDLDYYDPSDKKWRSEPVPNEDIPDGRPWQEVRNLEKVNEMNVRVRVDYRVPEGKGWSKVLTKESSRQICSKGKEYSITLTK